MPGTPEAERLLCDTSFVGFSAKRSADSERFSGWRAHDVDRVDRAILAISVITLAETRYGFLKANWGSARIEREEKRLAGFLQVPLDVTVLDEWARLRLVTERAGTIIADNDLWIAATAGARRYPLVTCDQNQARVADAGLEVVYLPPPS